MKRPTPPRDPNAVRQEVLLELSDKAHARLAEGAKQAGLTVDEYIERLIMSARDHDVS